MAKHDKLYKILAIGILWLRMRMERARRTVGGRFTGRDIDGVKHLVHTVVIPNAVTRNVVVSIP